MRFFWLWIAVFALFVAPVEAANPKAKTRPVGSKPLPDREAAKRVRRSGYEPRLGNRAENRRVLTRRQLGYFRRHSEMTYRRRSAPAPRAADGRRQPRGGAAGGIRVQRGHVHRQGAPAPERPQSALGQP